MSAPYLAFVCLAALLCSATLADTASPARLPVLSNVGTLTGLRLLADIPLRDPSICRGPDGTWYLTGTSQPFWGDNNRHGIRIWKSRDFVTWGPLGTVWRYGGSPWHKPYLEKKKPLWAPELHSLKGTFWLTYSMPGWDGPGFDRMRRTSGSGLLKSITGRPEGPYTDVQPHERLGDEIDGSLFEDEDGTVYFLWHCGRIARMKPDLSSLAEPPRQLRTTAPDPDPAHHGSLCRAIFGDGSFDHVGFEGAFLLKVNDLYYLACAESYEGRYSCMVATSTNIYGPYSARYEAIPHGGHNVFFQDECGDWWSTIFNGPVSERPAVVPIRFEGDRITLLPPDSKDPRATAPDSRLSDNAK